MRDVIILAAGDNTKFWPYTQSNKVLFPVVNKPLIQHTVDSLIEIQCTRIFIAAKRHPEELKALFRNTPQVKIFEINQSKGTADTLLQCLDHLSETFTVLYGDVYYEKELLQDFVLKASTPTLAVTSLEDDPKDVIGLELNGNQFIRFGAHERGQLIKHAAYAFCLDQSIRPYLMNNPHRFSQLKVGVGSPLESYLEESLQMFHDDHQSLKVSLYVQKCIDIDKPWHGLMLNASILKQMGESLHASFVQDCTIIDQSASINGFIYCGKNVEIGKHVKIIGPVFFEDNVKIDHGAIIEGPAYIGKNTTVLNHAYVHSLSVIGSNNKLSAGFEFLGGVTLNHVYMVHYGEFYGCIGEHSDLGAGTTCGTLRFDDGNTLHRVKGRKEFPKDYANASYLGAYTRTGVGVLLMPGVKVGAYSVVGSGVVLEKDLKEKTLIYLKQDLVESDWGPEKYGW